MPTFRRAVSTLVVTTAVLLGVLCASVAAGAQGPTTTLVPLDDQPVRSPSIIPTPNSTSQPTQYLVMAAILLGLAAIVAMIVRESRRNKARRTHKPA